MSKKFTYCQSMSVLPTSSTIEKSEMSPDSFHRMLCSIPAFIRLK